MSDGPAEARPCVECGKAQAAGYKPFCSKRCADRDLHRWLSGGYAIPGAETDETAPISREERPE